MNNVDHDYDWYQEIVDLNPACPGDDVIDYQSMKSGEDPTLGIPVHEELTNAADSPTLVDFLHADVTREKEVHISYYDFFSFLFSSF